MGTAGACGVWGVVVGRCLGRLVSTGPAVARRCRRWRSWGPREGGPPGAEGEASRRPGCCGGTAVVLEASGGETPCRALAADSHLVFGDGPRGPPPPRWRPAAAPSATVPLWHLSRCRPLPRSPSSLPLVCLTSRLSGPHLPTPGPASWCVSLSWARCGPAPCPPPLPCPACPPVSLRVVEGWPSATPHPLPRAPPSRLC